MRLRSMTILFFSSLLLSTSVVAEELDLELYFDGVKPSEALALSGVYATEENSCIDIIIDGSEGRVQEADRNLSKGTYDLPIDDLCMLTLLNTRARSCGSLALENISGNWQDLALIVSFNLFCNHSTISICNCFLAHLFPRRTTKCILIGRECNLYYP